MNANVPTMLRSLIAAAFFLLLGTPVVAQAAQAPWPVKVVVVVTYEIGKDTGDTPGEFQAWAEREKFTQSVPFPAGVHPILTNADHSVLGVVSGMGLVNATASIMALGMDPRFDLTRAYWLINGTAGVDPKVASVGSAAWATYLVGDVARYLDPREAPPAWKSGFFAMGATEPGYLPAPGPLTYPNTWKLNPGLVRWAYERTKNIPLDDTPAVAAFRADFTDEPNAQRAPFVLLGDAFSGDTFWHGTLSTRYAEDWVKTYTNGAGTFAMTDMEDTGFAEALQRLDNIGRVDFRRLLVLRTGSNFSAPRPGHTSVESITAPYIGGRLAYENTWRVGSPIVHELVDHWPQYAAQLPGQ
jgi:purine nucleoside permease